MTKGELKQLIRKIIEDEQSIDEDMNVTGNIAGYQTKFAFGKRPKKSLEKDGLKVVKRSGNRTYGTNNDFSLNTENTMNKIELKKLIKEVIQEDASNYYIKELDKAEKDHDWTYNMTITVGGTKNKSKTLSINKDQFAKHKTIFE
ncbi:MAG: hypothetical protein M0R17_10545 [Candidatus Omnitrophica bacterium]|jgi:hypothetical protein|nr:hypothetical protein [Candidatus Omnitrophota bacterium]